jgi:hypothetical protein
MTQLKNNGETSPTFGELMGFHRYTEEDFPLGASFMMDDARAAEARQYQPMPRILTDGAMTFRQLLLAQAEVAVTPVQYPLQKTA